MMLHHHTIERSMGHRDTEIEYPDTGPWRYIERSPNKVTYFPRDSRRQARHEWTLPSGRVMIDDFHAGVVIHQEFYRRADLKKLKPLGRPIGDRATMKCQREGRDWFVFCFQERYDDADELLSQELVAIEIHRGTELIEVVECGG